MTDLSVRTSLPGSPAPAATPQRARDAAEQFEALLIGQMLRSVRESGSGWLGGGEDQSGECAMDLAEQHVARILAAQGGFGLARLIASGLQRESEPSTEAAER